MLFQLKMRGIHKERESFRIRKRRTKTEGRAKKKTENVKQNVVHLIAAVAVNSPESDAHSDDESAEANHDVVELDDQIANPLAVSVKAKEIASLYTHSFLSKPQAIQMLQLYRTRHRLTDAAFQDLLAMLHGAFLPQNNKLPRTLYSFTKALDEECVLQMVHSTRSYVVFDVSSQINNIVARNYASFVKHRRWMFQNADKFDYCGTLHRERLEEFISISIFTDGAAVGKSTSIQMWPIVGFVLDLPPKLQKSIENVVWIGLFVGNKTPDWNVFFAKITPQFVELRTNPITLQFEIPQAVAPRFKVRILELLADNIGRADILMMKKPPAKNCCPICRQKGTWDQEANCVIYPERNFQLRLTWIPDPPNGLANGIKGLSSLTDIVGEEGLLRIAQVDCMHTVYGGIFKRMLDAMYRKNRATIHYFDTHSMVLYRPREIRRRLRAFKLMAKFKMNEFRMILHFAVAVLMPGFADLDFRETESRMAVNCLLLAAGMHALATKNLTAGGISFAHRIFNRWHKTLPAAFDTSFLTFKAHQVLHLAKLSRKLGSCVHRTCFAGESVVGYGLARVTSPKDALIQISNRIKRIPANALDLTSKLWFSSTEFIETNQFTIKRWDLRPGNNENAIKDFFSEHYPNKWVTMSKRFQIEHFIIVSRALHLNFSDSIIYFESDKDQSARPAIVETFFKFDDEVRALIRPLQVVTTLAQSLQWVPDIEDRLLLTHSRAFAGCFIIKPEYGELYALKLERIITKGFIIDNAGTVYVFPTFIFDHD